MSIIILTPKPKHPSTSDASLASEFLHLVGLEGHRFDNYADLRDFAQSQVDAETPVLTPDPAVTVTEVPVTATADPAVTVTVVPVTAAADPAVTAAADPAVTAAAAPAAAPAADITAV